MKNGILISISHHQFKLGCRFLAKMIDILIFFFIAKVLFPYPFGLFLGLIYSLIADGMPHAFFQGQSIGKKLLKLQVVHVHTRKSAQIKDSILRNSPLGMAVFFWMIPIWGWMIFLFLGLPILGLEIYLMMISAKHRRLGDFLAETEVIEIQPILEE